MKFIQLDILHLASLDRPQGESIQFEAGALGQSNIFSIVGPTGSGKSTILDAICLALYNQAPRYHTTRKNLQYLEIYGTPSADEKHRLAPTDVRNILTRGKKQGYSKLTFLANDGTLYRAEWHVGFANVKYTKVVTLLYRLTIVDGKPFEETVEWSSIPQIIGLDYDQFLRTVLIAQGSFANFLSAREEDRATLLERLIGCEQLYGNISTRIQSQYKAATLAYAEVAQRCSAQQGSILSDTDLSQLRTRIAELQAVEQQVQTELQQLTEALAWYTRDNQYQQQIARFEQAFTEAQRQLEALRPQSERLALHDATLPAVSLHHEILQAQTKVAGFEQTLTRFSRSIGELQQEIYHVEQEQLAQLQQQVEQSLQQYEAANAQLQLSDAPRLQKAQTLAERTQSDLQSAIRIQEGLRSKREQQSQLLAQQHDLTERCQQIAQQLTTFHIETLSSEVDTLNQTYTLFTSERWQQHRTHLVEGEPCPLCGAHHHPYHDDTIVAPVADQLHQLLAQKRLLLQQQRDAQQQLISEQSKHQGLLTGIRRSLTRLATELDELNSQWGHLQTLYAQWPADAEALRALQPQAERQLAEASQALNAHNALARQVDQLRRAKEAAERTLRLQVDALSRQREQLSELTGQQSATQSQRQTELATVAERTEQLAAWLDAYNLSLLEAQHLNFDAIAQLSVATDQWEQVRAQLRQVGDTFTSAETTLRNERQAHQLHQQSRPEATRETLLERQSVLKQHSSRELIESQSRLHSHERALLELGTLIQQRADAEQLMNEWKEISEAIGTDGKTLRKIAQCYTLRFLIEHANAEIRKFNHRYELQQVHHSLGIRVIDHDRADDVRDTTSLSGGETFIVSLGLALGLSSLSSRHISFQNLFIDEGFGTLDPEALDSVIDSLAMLQTSQGKKVGVISHTDTMSERITTQIRVIKSGTTGSSYIEVYP